MAWDLINGEDLYEVRAKTHIAMERARKEHRPSLLEIQTYRYYGHSVADANANKYRTPEEIERYKTYHDPIRLWERRLIEEGVMTAEDARAHAMARPTRTPPPVTKATGCTIESSFSMLTLRF